MRCSRRVRCQVRVDTSRALFGLALETFHQQIPRPEFAKWFSQTPPLHLAPPYPPPPPPYFYSSLSQAIQKHNTISLTIQTSIHRIISSAFPTPRRVL